MKIASNTNAVGVACLLISCYYNVIPMGLSYFLMQGGDTVAQRANPSGCNYNRNGTMPCNPVGVQLL
jgi:hypothetical protein